MVTTEEIKTAARLDAEEQVYRQCETKRQVVETAYLRGAQWRIADPWRPAKYVAPAAGRLVITNTGRVFVATDTEEERAEFVKGIAPWGAFRPAEQLPPFTHWAYVGDLMPEEI